MTHAWDATTYDRISDPHVRWGEEVLARLSLAGDERVLDGGCGTGRVTQQLLERLPRGHVVAVDASSAMLAEAQRRLGDRVEFLRADLRSPLPIEPVDAVFSTATFHWIDDHASLFKHLAAVLKQGGQLVAQCGGAGNIASVEAAIRAAGDDWSGPWNFADVEETREQLAAAGFAESEVWLNPDPVRLEPGAAFESFLNSVVLGAHLERIPTREHDHYVRGVIAHMPRPEIDYVRLNIIARR